MKTFTIQDIRSWNPCYDPNKYLPEDWKGTVLDMLNNEAIPFEDRLWCVLTTELLSDKIMHLFAVWSYRQTLQWVKNPDPRSLKAAEVAEAYALGKATKEELSAARSDAEDAADSATDSAAWSAAMSAAWSAARSAAKAAAKSADWSAESARSAAWSAARSAAKAAAKSADWSVESARSAAESARSDAESAQRDKLIEMILSEENK